MFGLDNEVRTEPDGGGGVGDLQEGVTKTFSESGADGGRSESLKMLFKNCVNIHLTNLPAPPLSIHVFLEYWLV